LALLDVRDPILTSFPSFASFVPIALPTIPVPKIAIFMIASRSRT
jgi:hypothetical protein